MVFGGHGQQRWTDKWQTFCILEENEIIFSIFIMRLDQYWWQMSTNATLTTMLYFSSNGFIRALGFEMFCCRTPYGRMTKIL